MRQLRDVIVRKRPRARQEDSSEDVPYVRDFAEIAAERPRRAEGGATAENGGDTPGRDVAEELVQIAGARTAPPAPEAPAQDGADDAETAAPKIWDLEPEPDPDREDAAPEAPAPAVAPGRTARAGRVKTRLVGFHGEELPKDVFAQPPVARAPTAEFPAGWLVVGEGPGRGASFSVAAGVSTIGRGDGQTIQLDFGDTSISRDHHAAVAYDDEQNRFFVGHGGKSNIVRRNGNPVLATEDLEDGDLIRVGKTVLRFVALCGPGFRWELGETDGQADAAGR
ncbi:FHA domain-containing protein [Rhodosalinus sp. FB01]|uniref:FHA domain-containing protein n=1 Tax=Rhodosalinus sp. FB01 TaxID=3239194 RepID=UPI003523F83A